MSGRARYGAVASFRWLRLLAISAVVAAGLIAFRRSDAAIGIALGIGLSSLNLLLLYEAARSLVPTRGRRIGVAIAVGSIFGRFAFLAVSLTLIAVHLGHETLLGACGGLLLSQVNLRFPLKRSTEAV